MQELSLREKEALWREQGRLYMNMVSGNVDKRDNFPAGEGEVVEVYKDQDGNFQSVYGVEFVQ